MTRIKQILTDLLSVSIRSICAIRGPFFILSTVHNLLHSYLFQINAIKYFQHLI
jgi:hypothetical protein